MAYENLIHPWDGCKGYKVYHKKEGRYMMCIIKPNGDRTTTSYARYKMSVHLKRFLLETEHVDHKDEDKTNDNILNLQILTQAQNNQKHVLESNKSTKMIELICPVCGTYFERTPQRVRFKINQGKEPTCSRTCGAIWGHQNKQDFDKERQ